MKLKNPLRINLSRLNRQFAAIGLISTLAAWLGVQNQKWVILTLPLVAVMTWYVLSRTIATRKKSLWLLKTIRPLIMSYGLLLLVTSGTLTFVQPTIITLLMAAGFGVVMILFTRYEMRTEPSQRLNSIFSLLAIFLITNASAQMQAVWNVPVWLVLIVAWLLYYVIANFWLYGLIDKPESLALIWSLMAIEINLILSTWILFYSVPHLTVIVAQSALIVTVLAYSIGGIYYHNRKHTLSRSLIFEYLAVSLVVFSILLVLTKWFNTV